jgi:short-subunit dehydrogenase
MSPTELPDRYGNWAVVAGASAGLGAAFAASAASRGFKVALLARRANALDDTAAKVRDAHGVETRCIVADLASPGVEDAVARATDDLDVGLFVYNAAAEPAGRFLDLPLEEHRLNIAVNCSAPTALCHHFGRRMVDQGRGAIAIVSSMAALQGIRMFVSYGAAKAYELILAEGLWDELREHGVEVLSYVVGATASANYVGARPDAYHGADSTAADRVLAPATPEEVAERLLTRLDGGPRQYSHDTDETNALAAAGRPRADVVRAMGEVTSRLARFEAPAG